MDEGTYILPIKFARLSYPVLMPFIFFRTEKSERMKIYRRANKSSRVHPVSVMQLTLSISGFFRCCYNHRTQSLEYNINSFWGNRNLNHISRNTSNEILCPFSQYFYYYPKDLCPVTSENVVVPEIFMVRLRSHFRTLSYILINVLH
jgi:hypothetical protein